MKKHLYTLIGLGVLAGPLALSFDQKIHFWTYWGAYAAAALAVGTLYILWDALVTRSGHWTFNPAYTGTWRLAHLPLGEWIFFIAVPYACLFVWEVLRGYFPQDLWWLVPGWLPWILAGAAALGALLVRRRGYSLLALTSLAVFFAAAGVWNPGLLGQGDFLLFLGVSFGAFLVVNGLYTSLPTISYNPQAFSGIRIGSIPLEDFAYNLSMLGLYGLVYDLAKRALGL